MKIASVTIVLETSPENAEKDHATLIEFKDGMWRTNGPVFPRITAAMADVLRVLNGAK